ncbi:efflux RND transporter permease subunit [Bacillus sp. 1P06AnD]|uniref:efflux RND transporter permease subunit n=1 Tax=Bacillus sp. 1P06AnD TaxID=3132208 RepID=UPI0039A21F6E
MKLSAFSIRRPVFTVVTMIFVLLLGIVSLMNIPLKLIPDIDPPVAVVVTSYDGAGPVEVSEKVGKRLESNLSTLPGLKTMTSTSQEGANLILLQFSWTTKLEEVENDIMQRIESTPLPDDASKPRFMKFDPSQFPIVQLSLSAQGNHVDLPGLSEELRQQLLKVDGIANVNVSGAFANQIGVHLNDSQLRKYRLTQQDVSRAIAANNISLPGEKVQVDGKQLTTRVISSLTSTKDIEAIPLGIDPVTKKKVTVGDVSSVTEEKQEEKTITRTNDKPSVLLSIMQQSDANTAQVSKQFQNELRALLQKDEYKDVNAQLLSDQGNYISQAIGNISNTLIVGGVLAMFVLFIFLRSLRSPIIIGIAIPYSVIVTFVLMYFSGFTLNIMTLGALALGIGMLVDNSIVVIENIYRHLSMGKEPKKAAKEGAAEVGGAITASTLTTVVVFLPVAFIAGIIGDLFKEFALTISFSLFASLYVALTVVPMIASRWLKNPARNTEARRKASYPMSLLRTWIQWSLKHRMTVLIMTGLLLVAGLFGLKTVGTEFLPATDEGNFSIKIQMENGTSLKETESAVSMIEQQLKKNEDVDVYISLIGTDQNGAFRGTAEGNIAELSVKLKPLNKRNRSVDEVAEEVKKKVAPEVTSSYPGTVIAFSQQSSHGSAPHTLTFNLRGSDKPRLHEAATLLKQKLEETKGVTEVETDLSQKKEEVHIAIDRNKALEHGLVPSQLASVINEMTRGTSASQIVNEKGDVLNITVKYNRSETSQLDGLRSFAVKKPDGTFVELKNVASFYKEESPATIERINNQDAVQFTVKYKSEYTLGDISSQLEKVMDEQEMTKHSQIVYSGDKELLDSGKKQMAWALVLAVLFVYLVMAAQFESLKYPLVIMFSVPLIVIGVSIALTVTRTPIGITAMIGLIVLAGIVVNNAIVIVDYINQRKQKGMPAYEAIITSVEDRVRPILMTSLTTILGLVPIALALGEGTEINQPMGITVIGGLISSTFLTLFIVPVIYSFFDRQTRKKRGILRQERERVQSRKGNDEKETAVDSTEENLKELNRIIHPSK